MMIKKWLCVITVVMPMLLFSQNPLFIPDTLSGTDFNLMVQTGTVQFTPGHATPTYGINGNFLGPTLFLKKNDSVTIHVTNQLPVQTTMHWHGLHVPPEFDGGPHQIILPSTTWSPRFKVMNNAGTFWYHPHGNGTTELHVTKGLAGMIIIRDSLESTLNLPRTYGVDDFPIILQSRVFDVLYQIAGFTLEDSIMMVNGTIDPYQQVPAQMVRLRVLNGSVDRTYQLGLSNDSSFYQIATDGGLIEQPNKVSRLRLSPGERAEIVVNFSGLMGQTIHLMSYASELSAGIMGSADVSMGMATLPGYSNNPLNGADFSMLQFNVVAPTASPITNLPASLVTLTPWLEGTENTIRSFSFAPAVMGMQQMIEGPFVINGQSFIMDSINVTTYLNHIEIWDLTNTTAVAHPFHVHDIQFYVLDRNGFPVGPSEKGWKDVVLVKPSESVRIITKFTDFHHATIPYMYHCHLLHHEDEGMMGSFIVLDSASLGVNDYVISDVRLYPNPTTHFINLQFQNDQFINGLAELTNTSGQRIMQQKITSANCQMDVHTLSAGIYFLRISSATHRFTKKIIIQ